MERKVSLVPETGPSLRREGVPRSVQATTLRTGPVNALSGTSAPGGKVVALGADHGGFVMKETLKAYLQDLGYGVMIDGAGIGSCMVANKVPGVRASMCYDLSTAVNSREHNDANVLTLGGQLIGDNLAKQIVKAWLETEFAGGRHERRVDKIMGVEKRFLRK